VNSSFLSPSKLSSRWRVSSHGEYVLAGRASTQVRQVQKSVVSNPDGILLLALFEMERKLAVAFNNSKSSAISAARS
jgi:hypothetical protein